MAHENSGMKVENIENSMERTGFVQKSEQKSNKLIISQQLYYLKHGFIPKEDPLLVHDTSNFCYKFLFNSTSDDRKLNNLEELTQIGQHFLVCCLHILLETNSVHEYEKTLNTWNWIKKNGKLKISMENVFDMIKNWIANPKAEDVEDLKTQNTKESTLENSDNECSSISSILKCEIHNENEIIDNKSIEVSKANKEPGELFLLDKKGDYDKLLETTAKNETKAIETGTSNNI